MDRCLQNHAVLRKGSAMSTLQVVQSIWLLAGDWHLSAAESLVEWPRSHPEDALLTAATQLTASFALAV